MSLSLQKLFFVVKNTFRGCFSRRSQGSGGQRWSSHGVSRRVGRRREQERRTGDARVCLWALVEPRHDPIYIDCCGGGDGLQVSFLEPPVPGAPQPAAPDALREGPFDPGSSLIALLALLTAIPCLCRSQRLVLVLGRQAPRAGPAAAPGCRPGGRDRPDSLRGQKTPV